ncbi:Conserved_hypothetical protein [Hexamita inflata]|uniref:Uncharacterized protein n=1 Tax=Hexamita inflata TaxID=28002 RepID=A0AA86R5P1_9EUKA|nr:Conserved hypothetical protein [Hexamita inflata]
MNQNTFTSALFEFLQSKNVTIQNDPKAIYNQLQTMTVCERRGIWEFVASIIKVTTTQSHNYYHNTWCMQFYDDISPYRHILTNLVKQNSQKDSSELVQQFLDQYKDKNFSRHAVQQIVNIQKLRTSHQQNPTNQIGFSANISQCVRYLDAVNE